MLMFPGGCDVQISEDTEVDKWAGYSSGYIPYKVISVWIYSYV